MSLALAVAAVLLVVAIETAAGALASACQWFFSRRPLLGRRVSLTSSLPGEGDYDGPQREQPHFYRTIHGRLLSSPLDACRTADLESAAIAPLLPLAAITSAPDGEAFGLGVEVMVFTVLATIAALVVVNWIVKTMRSGDSR